MRKRDGLPDPHAVHAPHTFTRAYRSSYFPTRSTRFVPYAPIFPYHHTRLRLVTLPYYAGADNAAAVVTLFGSSRLKLVCTCRLRALRASCVAKRFSALPSHFPASSVHLPSLLPFVPFTYAPHALSRSFYLPGWLSSAARTYCFGLVLI